MSIQNNFPALKPTLLLDFANTKELDPRITFTRASTATYYGTQSAKAEENLLIRSQEFDAANWVNSNTTETANTAVAPDGTTTADTLTNTTATGGHTIDQASTAAGFSIVSGQAYTISVFAKKNTNDFFQITTFNASNTLGTGRANFDLQNGTAGTVDGGTSTITSVGNGWYRCTYTVTASASGAVNIYFGIITTSTAARFESYTGLGTESIYLWGAQVEQRSAATAYTATTTQPITNYIPQLLTAASGVARFDHNPTTFESLGLLIEEQRTNLVLRSEEFDNAAWTKSNATIIANTIVSPDGTVDADKLVEDVNTGGHSLTWTQTVTAGVAYVLSLYAKEDPTSAKRYLTLYSNSGFTGTASYGCTFDLGDGTVTRQQNGFTGTITPVGNGWYRCAVFTTLSTGSSAGMRISLSNSASDSVPQSYTGNGYSGIYIWGAQLEAGAFATSYIPTVASQVTRAADTPTITGTNFSSWYNNAQGTLYSEASTYDLSSGGRTGFSVNDGTPSNRTLTGHGTVKAFISKSGTTQYTNSFGGVTVTNNVASRVALAYASNNVNAAVNGVIGGVDDTVVEVPVVTQSNIGSIAGASSSVNGTIRKIAYYPIRLTNAQLQALTS